MKHKVSELEGALLDEAVAKAEGYVHESDGIWCRDLDEVVPGAASFSPSTLWQHGGPIIEREGVSLTNQAQGGRMNLPEWSARKLGEPLRFGPTPLIAAMRAYVASKLGDEVDLP